jgi:protein TonB
LTKLRTTSINESSFIEVEKFPQFTGGEKEQREFFRKKLNKEIVGNHSLQEGKVFATVSIDTIGNITNVKITKSYSQLVDDEFVRVIKLMPKWIPGKLLINGTKGPWVKHSFDMVIPLKIPYNE